jgi:hypothetical protein
MSACFGGAVASEARHRFCFAPCNSHASAVPPRLPSPLRSGGVMERGIRSATGVSRKRRRRCALPTHSKRSASLPTERTAFEGLVDRILKAKPQRTCLP